MADGGTVAATQLQPSNIEADWIRNADMRRLYYEMNKLIAELAPDDAASKALDEVEGNG